ncbi:hypothetical protein HBH56_135890 [Parastagonospora nodorum]|uniref:Uncharacterized protein n=1 Tax=Phaeosphaeria nodorum (strain SN15 / ATCC MYA-4574 / FGSC 10173) TaxID=321614 RepID=A0A7U2FE32_PHANO|nr:hypothetical protein HBH56_135890 [Parastagonospora nodorum]QRD02544.1 hypothetical protein JI435_112990 [Parastagonospora nodorum SN15]KAH3926860.1 hypothetical protein HBH54_157400 [Parastagonospora nodorum]KAH3956509.1 hypothetical protein HBH51_240500 [Parastagonospora nodorum]KAH4048553.1 hypothetical protein HBH49_160130 [Parastagonospora nodorum]
MSSSSREKATPPASPVLRGRSPWRAGDVPVKTKRSRTLGRVAVLLMLLGVLGYVGMGWGVCGEKCTKTTEWLENGARRTGEYVGGGSVLPSIHGTEAFARQQAAMLALASTPDSSFVEDNEAQREKIEEAAQQAQIQETAQHQQLQQQEDDEVTRADMVDAMNGQGDHTNETELVEEKEPEHVHVQSAGVGEGGEAVMGSIEGVGGGF